MKTPEIVFGPTLNMRTSTLSDCELPTCPVTVVEVLGTATALLIG